MTEDQIDIYDENMNPLGTAPIVQAHQEGLWHKSFHCWIVKRAANHDHKVWIQLRSKNKYNSPQKLDVSAAGHLRAGEDPKAGIRKAEEELGLKIPEQDINKLFTARHITMRRNYKNYEFNPTYLYETDKELEDLSVKKEQVDGIFEAGLKDMQNLFNKKVSQIFIGGLKADDNGELKPHTGSVNINDFVAHDIKYYQKALKIIENYFEGKPVACDIRPLMASDYNEVLNVWEKSVRATHYFLKPEEIAFYRPLILKYALPKLIHLFGIRQDNKLCGFIGLSEQKIEMLFIAPEHFRRGLGTKLLNHAIALEYKQIDVNEENPGALKFYQHRGFHVISRDELDDNGKHHPILHLSL